MFDWAPLLISGPCYIGILNCTPDSFSDGGLFAEPHSALRQALRLVNEGAKVIDIGAESTRPGSTPISESEEWSRIEKVIPLLRRELPADILISIDTRHPLTAQRALDFGANVLNDVMGFSNPMMLRLLNNKSIGAIAMRSTITENILVMPNYASSRSDTATKLEELISLTQRLKNASINPQQCLLDIGFGFGTTYNEDAFLWDYLQKMKLELPWPIDRFCIGLSRKRFLVAKANQADLAPEQRDALTHNAVFTLLGKGYRFFRVHAVPRYA